MSWIISHAISAVKSETPQVAVCSRFFCLTRSVSCTPSRCLAMIRCVPCACSRSAACRRAPGRGAAGARWGIAWALVRPSACASDVTTRRDRTSAKDNAPASSRSGALRGGQSVVEYQGAHIPAEWELLLGGLVGCSPGSSADLGIARALVNGYVSRGDRCKTEHRCGQAASDQGGKSELLHFDAFFDLCCGAVRGRRTRTFFVGPVCTAFDRSDSSNAVVRALIPVAEIDRQLAGISHFNGRRFAGRQATAQSGRATLRQTGCSDGVVRYCCAVWCSRMRRTVV